MMILPAILENDFAAVKSRVAFLENIVNLAQLDLTDGVFVSGESWHNPREFAELKTGLKFDLHLMVERPEKWVEDWATDAALRLTFHWESTYDARRTVNLIREKNKEVGLALKLETPLDKIEEIISDVDALLLLAIEPGGQGRSFDYRVLPRIRALRAQYPDLDIGVDGGINIETGQKALAAGANILVSGSFIWNSLEPKEAIISLQNLS